MRILFVCKQRLSSGGSGKGASFGLFNSARLVVESLNALGIEAKVVNVLDNNCIDREVTKYNPTHVIIEALWVVPEKFEVLLPLHSKRQWIVRVHSKIPFLSMEGIAVNWLRRYAEIGKKYGNFVVSANNIQAVNDISRTLGMPCLYQPNIYAIQEFGWRKYITQGLRRPVRPIIDIGCFGAIRPFKNHLVQAFAAIQFADDIGRRLRFHVNGSRTEQKGEQVLKNMEHLFPVRGHELVSHGWLKHADFLMLVRSMDMGMQVSMTESFNIVAADFVFMNVPIVVSPDIAWVSDWYKAKPHSTESIVAALHRAWSMTKVSFQSINMYHLMRYNRLAKEAWSVSLSRNFE